MTNLLFEIENVKEELTPQKARIGVVGVGGGGGNSVDTMVTQDLSDVEFIVANTDAQNLSVKKAQIKIQLGGESTRGLGAGANPQVGRDAAEHSLSEIRDHLENLDLVFVAAGMGGGTGTGAAPVIARTAKEMGALTVGIVTKPFSFEAGVRMRNAEQGIADLEDACDTVLVIPNDRILQLAPKGTPAQKAFAISDQVLFHAVAGISRLITSPGAINLDYADVSKVMLNGGKAMMGAAIMEGEDRARKAMEAAIESPLIEDASIQGARSVLVNMTGHPEKMLMEEITEAMNLLKSMVDEEKTEIIFGSSFDEAMGDRISVTLIAAGFGQTVGAGFGSGVASSTTSGSRSFSSGFGNQSISDIAHVDPVVMREADPNMDEVDVPAYMRLSKGNNPYRH